MRRLVLISSKWLIFCAAIWFLPFGQVSLAAMATGEEQRDYPLATNIYQLQHAASREKGRVCAFVLQATVLAADSNSGVVFLQDDSGEEAFEMDLQGQTLRPGQKIRLQGTNYVNLTDSGLSLGKHLVVNNDGLHTAAEKSGSIYLRPGQHPIRVYWFNQRLPGSLEVSYEGPGMARRAIPKELLFRRSGQPGQGNQPLVNGLDFRDYEGWWEPGFWGMSLVKTGVTADFNIKVETRPENVGLEFAGFLKVAVEGLYTFYLNSDDGSLLYLDDSLQLTKTGIGPVPTPRQINPEKSLPAGQASVWTEVEGTVTFLTRQQGGAKLELGVDDRTLRVKILKASGEAPRYLLHSRVRIRGLCHNAYKADGQNEASLIEVPNWESVQVLTVDPESWCAFNRATVDELAAAKDGGPDSIVCVSGQLSTPTAEGPAVLSGDKGSMPIELLSPLPDKPGAQVECLAIWSRDGTNAVLRQAIVRESSSSREEENNLLPLLTTAVQVQQLSREEAQRQYPVKLTGVVTWVGQQLTCFVIQDATHAVTVFLNSVWDSGSLVPGECFEIEGVSNPAEFSPVVDLRSAKRLGVGQMPAPAHPTLDQLISGSMDAQYIEIRGLVTSVHANKLSILTPEGMLDLEIVLNSTEPLDSCLNALVRLRGCLFQNWEAKTHQVIFNQPLRLENAIINVDVPPPIDPFNTEKISVAKLMQFDVRGGLFRRVKVSVQILQSRDGLYYATADGIGLRIQPAQPGDMQPGDNVDVVGFVELGGASPVLREAVVRKTARAQLPPARELVLDRLGDNFDSTLVWAEGLLVDEKDHRAERLLEMQIGLKTFVARLPAGKKPAIYWPIGSRLKLTGVFAEQNVSRRGEHGVNSFELLLNSSDDIQMIAQPPWWTLDRLLAAITILAVGLLLAFLWITLLRRQVERRTVQLKREMDERERAEKGRAIEQERARIARDLHDDLGSNLTEISMLAMTASEVKLNPKENSECLQQIADKSCSMVTALDELVWAVNPKNDTIASLAEYLASFADEFFSRTQITCEMEIPPSYPQRVIAAETRHHVVLSVKEAFNNAVRHGHPTEVSLRLNLLGSRFEIAIQDNGIGFDLEHHAKGNGLANLQARMQELNGQCRIQSTPGKGTLISLDLPM